ncbi:MAG: hypothetical protein M1828_006654 [Chrysothrix sp. TS-e1954]|nr:MAG: hypothetical protein M1828_006654 [Chrysothrix sp. TS-e1954]
MRKHTWVFRAAVDPSLDTTLMGTPTVWRGDHASLLLNLIGQSSLKRIKAHSFDRPKERANPTARHAYASTRTSSRPSTPPPKIRAASTLRTSWPPSPRVENERASLAREYKPPRILDTIENEARSRGSCDQTPLILDVEGSIESATTSNTSSKTSGRPRVPELSKYTADTSSLLETPELYERAPSPYILNSRQHDTLKESRIDSGYFSSADLEARLHAEKRKTAQNAKHTSVSDALRGEGKYRRGSNDPQRHAINAGSGDNPARRNTGDTASPTSRQDSQGSLSSPTNGPRVPRTLSEEVPSHPIRSRDASKPSADGLGSQTRLAGLKSRAVHRNRRSSESGTAIPNPNLKRPGTSSLVAAATVAAGVTQASRTATYDFAAQPESSSSSRSASRPSSPATPLYNDFSGGTHSPRKHAYRPSRELSSSVRSSLASSRAGSLAGSRPSSPESFDTGAPAGHKRRVQTFPTPSSDAMQGAEMSAAPLTSAEHQAYFDRDRRRPAAPSRASIPLPYPVDDMNLMPSEEDHRYKPRALDETISTSISAHARGTKGPNLRRLSTGDPSRDRPRLDSRRTVASVMPSILTSPNETTRIPHSPTSVRGSAVKSAKAAPPCPRSRPTRQTDDWYVLQGCRDFNICPTCLDANFGMTSFKKYFKQSTGSNTGRKVKCDFASPWMRLAWSLTQDQHRFDLDLIYAVAHLDATESACSGEVSDTRIWYGVMDRQGQPIENFEICPCDAKKAEVLMPSLRGLFSRRNMAQKRKCDFRAESRRLPIYLELLSDLHQDAVARRRSADTQSFTELARHKARVKECERDNLLKDREWHFSPRLPEFTVCEECYSSVVWPSIANGSSVANRFNRTPQLLHEDRRGDKDRRSGSNGLSGISCQLYSPRMRGVFEKAASTGDFEYLARRALERKKAEADLSIRFASLRKKVGDIDRVHGKGAWQHSIEGRGLQSQLDAVAQDWSKWE